MVNELWAIVSAIIVPVLGFPFYVGTKRPQKFFDVCELYFKALFFLFFVAFFSDVFYQAGQYHATKTITGSVKFEDIDVAFFEYWQWAYIGLASAYFSVLVIFNHFVVSEN